MKEFFTTKSALFTELKKLSVSRNGGSAKLVGNLSNCFFPLLFPNIKKVQNELKTPIFPRKKCILDVFLWLIMSIL